MSDPPAGYDGLIDPSQFPFRSDGMDLEALERVADGLRGLGSGVSGSADDIATSWAGLRPVYEGPGQERVWGLMAPVTDTAGRLQSDLSTAADRLDELSSTLAVLQGRMADLERRAAEFRASVVDGVWAPVGELGGAVPVLGSSWTTVDWTQDTDTVAKNEDLLLEHAKLVEDTTTASADCHNALMDLVRWATDADDVVGVDAAALMDRRVQYAWGTPVTEDRGWGESIDHGAYMFGFNLVAGASGLLLGYDLRTQEFRDGLSNEMALGIANFGFSSGVTMFTTMLYALSPGGAMWAEDHLPEGVRGWLDQRRLVTASGLGDMAGVDVQAHLNGEDGLWRWHEDAIATGTESALNIASMFAPSGGAASGALRTGALGARLLRLVTGAADFLVPGTSALAYGGIRVVSRLATAIRRLDDVPVVEPNVAGVVGETVDLADGHGLTVERPVSDELFGDGGQAGGTDGTGGIDAAAVDDHHGPASAPPIQVDRTQYAETISVQRQGRHVLGSPGHRVHSSYFLDTRGAQRVLDAFHDGTAEILGIKPNGDVVVRVEGVTGYNSNAQFGYINQPTNVFFIKGTVHPSVVPYNPNWTPQT